ncbi:hypothetical protein Q4488_10105 [Amphritea sp. 1_MG-2023]|uniref:hypothetical protein n=1 Tax=Amphritea sp. 1_MG-2023 TaxID=3062670 RepID=UPI0026E1CC38|nr:hypothetical protein [Amphritea sp. 1_MG-2023]MDO6563733.1 hypothetical protein [Amphritea sp. 1_MG-2023]
MNFNYISAVLFSGLSLIASISYANDFDENLSVNGFVTQGFFYTDDNNVYGESSDNGSFDFHEIGLNAAYRFTPKLRGAVQLMSRQAGEIDNGEPKLDYALLDYRFTDSVEQAFGVRIGRLKVPFGFYNETRDVAFTRPGIMLPQSIYFDQARDLELSIDGAILYGSISVPSGWLDIDLLYGSPQTDTNVEYAYLSMDAAGKFDDSEGVMGRVIFNSDGGRVRIGTTLAEYRLGYEPAGGSWPYEFNEGDLKLNVAMLSAQYNTEHWSLTGEYMVHDIDWTELGGIFSLRPKTPLESYYLQLQYRVNSQWDLLLRYDHLMLDGNDPQGKLNSQLFGKKAYDFYSKDIVLGVGWQPNSDWLFRAELHNVEGTGWAAEQDNPDTGTLKKHWHIFALQATYRF